MGGEGPRSWGYTILTGANKILQGNSKKVDPGSCKVEGVRPQSLDCQDPKFESR